MRLKVCLLGPACVGKTCLLQTYVKGEIVSDIASTIGIDFVCKSVYINNKPIKVEFWDTAGAERFQNLIPSYVRDSHVVCLIFDRTNVDENMIYTWLNIVEQRCCKETLVSLLLNKHDLTVPSDINGIDTDKIINSFKRNGWDIVCGVTSVYLPHLFKTHIEKRLGEVNILSNITKPTVKIRRVLRRKKTCC